MNLGDCRVGLIPTLHSRLIKQTAASGVNDSQDHALEAATALLFGQGNATVADACAAQDLRE
jgi:hypothetical protein